MFGEVIFGHLRGSVMVAWLVAVNALSFFAMWLQRRYPEVETAIGYISLTVILCGTAAFALSIANSERVRAFAVGSADSVPALSKELHSFAGLCVFLWAVCGFVGLVGG